MTRDLARGHLTLPQQNKDFTSRRVRERLENAIHVFTHSFENDK
ncbi:MULTISPECIES: hypothetical protein [unclassified Ensifer]|nr:MULTISPECIES: hypothetical protein [unclassified Ensifer]